MNSIKSPVIVIMLLLGSFFVAAQSLPNTSSSLNVEEASVNIKLSQGQTKTAVFHVKNTGSTQISLDFIASALDLIDNDGDRITVSFSDPGMILPGDASNVTITTRADLDIDFENYGGIVTVKDRNSTALDTFTLNIDVTPDVCNFGQIPGDLVLDIKDPDDNEEVEPGEMLSIKANVKNNGRNDRRIKVEAFLFTESGREIGEAASPSMNLEDGNDDDFELEINIPTRGETLGDVDDEFRLFVKAFDDEDERLACIQGSVLVDIKIPKKKVVIEKANTRFFPSSVSCGETAVANIQLLNIGEKDNKVMLTLQNSELKVQNTIPNIQIDSFNSEERNTETRQIEVVIPKDASKKDYSFNLRADYEGGSATHEMKLAVVSCDEDALLLSNVQTSDIMSLQTRSFDVEPGDFVVIPVEITNNFNKKTSFTLSLRNIGDIGRGAVKSVLLSPGQKTTMFMELSLDDDIRQATYSAVVELATNEGTIASDTVTLTVKEEKEDTATITDLLRQLPFSYWIVLNIVLLGLVILSIKIVTTLR